MLIASAAFILAGCGGSSHQEQSPPSPPTPLAPQSAPTRAGELGALTASGLVAALRTEGVEVLNPSDVTAQECPAIGCDQAVVTDRFRIMSFDNSREAQLYAGNQGLHQVATVVVAFAPAVPQPERDEYWAAIVRLVL